ncbi:unnamed protein product [Mytilus edulis]|uniref:Fibronectin type-III domain-containing protein n=1 Tax=Mytilus edulis TaxID=6550 RepID=A0A8S3SZU9_MYTED|nr:unnamed protein product [Mytilus edulis]
MQCLKPAFSVKHTLRTDAISSLNAHSWTHTMTKGLHDCLCFVIFILTVGKLQVKPTDVRLEGVFTVEENDTVAFTCTSIGSRPAPNVTTLYIYNEPVNKSSTVVYDNITDTYTSFVTETRMIDRGYSSVPVFCFVTMTNLAYTGFDSETLDVHYGPGSSIRLSPNITSIELDAGTQVPVIRCIADCNPECQYTWYLTSGIVKTGSELNLGNASSYWHIGEVKCKAENDDFRKKYTAYINFTMYIRHTYYTNETTTCQYDCSTKSVLTIEHAECLDHRSHYTCHARPAHDNVYNFTLREEEGINLTANYLSIPTPNVFWYFKHTPTSTNRRVYEDSSYGGQDNFYYTSQYEIKDIRSYDFGQYLAVAINYVWNAPDSTIIFNIFQDKTGWPLRPYDLEVRCTENSAELSWISAYNGGSMQTFTSYYSYFKPGNDNRGPEEITDTGEGTRIKINIQPLYPGYSFFFTVSATNINGTTESDTYVNCTTSKTGKLLIIPMLIVPPLRQVSY